MCGIVGYVGDEECASLLVDGLRKLEYRGYDSAGLAVLGKDGLSVIRAKGKLQNLENRLRDSMPQGATGIGHTRWATHGKPSDENAHPHKYDGVAVVHNGIIENHLELKADLQEAGHKFGSETDTEIFAHLIADEEKSGKKLPDAVRGALAKVKGTYALAVVSEKSPEMLVVAKNASPLVLGIGEHANYVASDVPAILAHTRNVIFLEEGDFAVITKKGIELTDRAGKKLERKVRRIDWTPTMAEKNGHKHFMHKEIHEQARALTDTIRGRASVEEGDVFLDGCHLDAKTVANIQKISIVACGTSWHASLTGKLMIETLAKIPVEIDLASEFRYREPLVDEHTLCIAVSQSGETADTLGSFREAKSRGARGLAICNVLGSAIAREADDVLYTHAGPEIGVASTKAFTTQLAAFFLLAVRLGRLRGTLDVPSARRHLEALRELPSLVEQTLKHEEEIKQAAYKFSASRDLLFLGRGPQYPVALEGALKLKEISYIHAEGYAAGEMKHGPIALIDENMPVMVLAPRDSASEPGVNYEKILGNIQEVKARGGRVIAIHTDNDKMVPKLAECSIAIPQTNPLLQPIISVIPTQLFSYHLADHRGTDVDQPRNLAKSVTVE
jgi:glucosamine--fructose-6-phosphate aminotransferase (isomerizing)